MDKQKPWEPENPYGTYKDGALSGSTFDTWIAYAEGVRDGQHKLLKWLQGVFATYHPGNPDEDAHYTLLEADWQALLREVGLES